MLYRRTTIYVRRSWSWGKWILDRTNPTNHYSIFWKYKEIKNQATNLPVFVYRICPLPWTMYLYVVNSSSPIGPRAWSFCMEMPISQPKPNWPPSVNRVEQFIYTVALSTDCEKRLACSLFVVRMDSLCFVECFEICSMASSTESTILMARI